MYYKLFYIIAFAKSRQHRCAVMTEEVFGFVFLGKILLQIDLHCLLAILT